MAQLRKVKNLDRLRRKKNNVTEYMELKEESAWQFTGQSSIFL